MLFMLCNAFSNPRIFLLTSYLSVYLLLFKILLFDLLFELDSCFDMFYRSLKICSFVSKLKAIFYFFSSKILDESSEVYRPLVNTFLPLSVQYSGVSPETRPLPKLFSSSKMSSLLGLESWWGIKIFKSIPSSVLYVVSCLGILYSLNFSIASSIFL